MIAENELLKDFNSFLNSLHFVRAPKGLYAPVEYVLSMGGKRIRPLLMLMAYNLYRDDIASIYNTAAGIEIYHNYTLLHDDLMDRADRRRGKKTVHKVWDENTAILSGDAMFVIACQFLADCPSCLLKEQMDLFHRTALEICEGQQMDMDFEHKQHVAENEYLVMIRLKTAVLLATSLKMGALLAGASADDANNLYDFGIQMGIAFQLKDDFLDVYGSTDVFGKNIGGDILCNKKTFLLVKAFELADEAQLVQLKYWIKTGNILNSIEKIQAVTDLYNQIGIKALCEHRINEYSCDAMKCLGRVNVEEDKKTGLKRIIEKLMYREV